MKSFGKQRHGSNAKPIGRCGWPKGYGWYGRRRRKKRAGRLTGKRLSALGNLYSERNASFSANGGVKTEPEKNKYEGKREIAQVLKTSRLFGLTH